jgi:hypothetical protein
MTTTYQPTPRIGDIIEYRCYSSPYPIKADESVPLILSRVIWVYSTGDVDVCNYSITGEKVRKSVNKYLISRIVQETQAKSLLMLEECLGKWLLPGEP